VRCDEARERFDDLRLGSARAETVASVREHLDRCASCSDEFAWSLALVGDLAAMRSVEAPPVDVADRVMRSVVAERLRHTWPLAAAASVLLAAILVALGASIAPVRGTVRLASETAAALPTALATAGALAGGLRSLVRAVLPDPAWIERALPFLLSAGHALVAAILVATVLLAGREWRVARGGSGARS
jgi:predicted anti-sigma-YlaC factor YlaD